MTGTQVRVVTLRTAAHAPRAASGKDSSMTTTTEVDGDQNVIEPSTATTAAKGSDGPVNPVPRECQPNPTFRQRSPTSVLSGSSPPPASAGDPSSGKSVTTLSTAAARTTQMPPSARNEARAIGASSTRASSTSREVVRCSCTRRQLIRSGSIAAQPSFRFAARVFRARPTPPPNATANAAASSPPTAAGCFATRWPIARPRANGTRVSQWIQRTPADE